MKSFLQLLGSPFKALASFPRWFLERSLPARVAILVAIFLIIVWAFAILAVWMQPQNVPLLSALTPRRVLLLGVLVVVIPLVVYQALRLWLEGAVSRYPDIDYAWKAGVAELERNGLDLREIPIFLILGSADELQEQGLFEASRLSLRVKESPRGPAALHWYAHPEGIYLLCTQTSCLSKLASTGARIAQEVKARPSPALMEPEAGRATAGPSGPADASARAIDIRGTMAVGGTMEVGGAADLGEMPERRVPTLAADEAEEQFQRLHYVCQLLRRARHPLCPINGVLTLLPYGVMQMGPGGALEIRKALKADAAALLRGLELRCPVTAVVVGMEGESGFRELVRRVGPDRAASQRFGKGFGVWSPPTAEQLQAVAVHACGAFEDWVYTLFRERGALEKPGNTQLYSLLCKVRLTLQDRLAGVLAAGYAQDQDAQGAEPLLFGGCYFAAAGQGEAGQAFLRSVFEKLPEQQEDVEWTSAALGRDRRYVKLTYWGLAVNVVLLLGIVGMLVWRFAGR